MRVRFLNYLAIACFAVVAVGSAQAETISVGEVFRAGSPAGGDGFPDFLSTGFYDGTTRAWNLGGSSLTYNGFSVVGVTATSGTVSDLTISNSPSVATTFGPGWSGLGKNDIGRTHLFKSGGDVVLDIAATPGTTYQIEIVSTSGARFWDATVDGVLFADAILTAGAPEQSVVYRFNVTADADGIDLTLGADPDTPLIAAISATEITVIPEPSSLALLALAGGLGFVRRSRSRKC